MGMDIEIYDICIIIYIYYRLYYIILTVWHSLKLDLQKPVKGFCQKPWPWTSDQTKVSRSAKHKRRSFYIIPTFYGYSI